MLETAGALTADPAEVITDKQSIKGSYFGDASYTAYIRTDPNTHPLAANRRYQVSFRYKILATPDRGFEVLFYSPIGGAASNFLPSYAITGVAGDVGTATLTNTLGPYNDYQALWNIIGNGAIVIDDIEVVDVPTGEVIASEDAEGSENSIRLAQGFLPTGQVGRTYAVALAAWGGNGPYTWRPATPLPSGLQLAPDGYLNGRPSDIGSYVYYVVVTDSTGASVSLGLRLTVSSGAALPLAEPLTITDGLATIRPQQYELTFRNPLGGMRPNLSDSKSHPFASLGRQYIEWNLLENSESDTVDKIQEVTDQLFGDLPSYNIKVIPRVYLIWPKPLAKYWPSDLTPHDYTSPAFRSRMRRLIARLGEVWNNDPRIAFIEMGIIGWWGEHHHPGFASTGYSNPLPPEMEQEFGDAFRDAFPGKLLMNRNPTNFVDYLFGIHWDVFGSFDRGARENDTSGMTAELQTPRHVDRWKIVPRGGEIDPTFLDEPDFSAEPRENVVRKHTPRLIDIIQDLHWNHLDVLASFSLDPSDAELWEKASQIQNALGYRFIIEETAYSPVVQPGEGLTVRLKIQNVGSSPFYYPWPLEVSLHDAETRRLVWRSTWDGIDVRSWLPGSPVDIQRTFVVPGDLPAGEYVVAIAILDPSGMVPSARFAAVNYWMGGRTPLGPVSAAGALPNLQLNEFDDLQADRSLYYLPPSASTSVPGSDPTINPGGTVNSASFTSEMPVTAGSIATVFGSNLASAGSGVVTVRLNGIQAHVFGEFPTQISFQVPWELSGVTQLDMIVTVDGVSSSPVTVPLATFGPGLFSTDSSGSGQGAILIANTPSIAAPLAALAFPGSRPANRGEYISIYCTGLGPVTNQPLTGVSASGNPLSLTTTTPVVSIGGVPASVVFSGLAPGFFGLYQVNVQIPQNAPTGDAVEVGFTIGGVTSNTVTIAVQ